MENKSEKKGLSKCKWLYLWIAAAALIVFGLVMILNKDFGKQVVFYITGLLVIIFVIIRFVPLIKTTRNRWAIVLNAIEMFVDFVCGFLMIYLTAKMADNRDTLMMFYPFFVGGIIFVRGFIYLIEITFLSTKVETSKFFINMGLIVGGTIIMARYNSFSIESMCILLGVLFSIAGVIAVVDGTINYNNYRKLYVKKEKNVEAKDDIIDNPKDDKRVEINIQDPIDKREGDYIS